MRLSICPCFCCVFTGFDDAVRHRLWGSIWHALGSNSAGVPLFASMPHGCVQRLCPPIRADMSSYLPCAHLSIAILLSILLAVLRVSNMLFGTASGDQFGTPWARILLGFRCFASMPHGCVHRLCPPIRAYMSIYIRHDAPI